MADWMRKINLNPEWDLCKADAATVQECAKSIACKLRALAPFGPPTAEHHLDVARDEIADRFEAIADDPEATTDDINDAMSDLYDWGDTWLDDKWNGCKVCWIDTISPAKEVA